MGGKSARQLFKLALQCLADEGAARPTMASLLASQPFQKWEYI